MRALYNILFIVFFCLSAPYYFWKMRRRGNWREGFEQRFGKFGGSLKQSLTNRDVLWMHAVSVGEVSICTQLIKTLEPRLPNLKIVVSTTTSTGMGRLKEKLPAHIEKIYYPVDRRSYVRSAIVAMHPSAVVLVEAEIWPNFLWELQAAKIPVFLVNARLSERSFPRYRKLGFLFRSLFESFAWVGAQNKEDEDRLRQLGCRPDAIQIVDSLKFDAVSIPSRSRLDVPALFKQLGWPADALVLVAGSTHDGEEVLLARVFQRLRAKYAGLRLVLVPRHFERCRTVGTELKNCQLKFAYRNQVTASTRYNPGEVDCLLVNTTGELLHFYEHSTVNFIGKSITSKGGQNPIEPAAFGKAMVFGMNMQNFTAIAALFVKSGGALQVADETGLEQALESLLADEARRQAMGTNALKVVKEHQGGVEQTADAIAAELGRRGVHVAKR